MRHGMVAFALLVALLLAPATAGAQYAAQEALGNPNTYVTAYYNLNFGGDVYKGLSAATWDASRSHGVGASVTLFARKLVSAEVDFNYSHSFFGTSESLAKNYVLSTTLDGVVGPWFKMGGGRIRTYAVAGGGYMRGVITNRRRAGWDQGSKNLGLIEAGGGVLWLINDSLGVRADVRYRWGLGGKDKDGAYGKFDKFTYMKGTLGFSIAF